MDYNYIMKTLKMTELYMAKPTADEWHKICAVVPERNVMEAIYIASVKSGVVSGMNLTAPSSGRSVTVGAGLMLLRDTVQNIAQLYKLPSTATVDIPAVVTPSPKIYYIVASVTKMPTDSIDAPNAPATHPDYDGSYLGRASIDYIYDLQASLSVVTNPNAVGNSVVLGIVFASKEEADIKQVSIQQSEADATLSSTVQKLLDTDVATKARLDAIDASINKLNLGNGVGTVVTAQNPSGWVSNITKQAQDQSPTTVNLPLGLGSASLTIKTTAETTWNICADIKIEQGRAWNVSDEMWEQSTLTACRCLLNGVEVSNVELALYINGVRSDPNLTSTDPTSIAGAGNSSKMQMVVFGLQLPAGDSVLSIQHYFDHQWQTILEPSDPEPSTGQSGSTTLISELKIFKIVAVRIA